MISSACSPNKQSKPCRLKLRHFFFQPKLSSSAWSDHTFFFFCCWIIASEEMKMKHKMDRNLVKCFVCGIIYFVSRSYLVQVKPARANKKHHNFTQSYFSFHLLKFPAKIMISFNFQLSIWDEETFSATVQQTQVGGVLRPLTSTDLAKKP